METVFNLEKRYADDMIAHSRAEVPEEACGILAGFNGRVNKLYRATNVEHSPYRFSLDPRDLIAIYKEIRQKMWDLLAVYHSHTHTDAYPSPTDIELAALPQSLHIIVSLADPDQAVIRAFRIQEGQVSEVELRIIES
jgi:proteasome lid subunit RPN8/RPN11